MEEKTPARPKLPEGYKDEAEFLEEMRELFQRDVDFDRENREEGVEDLKFFAGEQWDETAKQMRANRPMLLENTLPQFVAQVVGDIRINRPAIKVRPAEDADKDLADIREGLIRAIERDNDAQGVYAETGTMQVACGIGNFRASLKYATDDGFDRDIAIEPIPDAFAVVWDAMSTERTGKDAQHCFVVDEMPRKAFERRWKDKIPSDLQVPLYDDRGDWCVKDTVRVVEYWLMKERDVEIALLEGGQVVELSEVPEGVVPVKTRKAQRRYACMYLTTGHALLSGPHEMPIDRVPIFRARGWEVNIGSRRVRWGLVRFARDPQRLRNYWRSIQAESLALAPKDKWLVHEQQEGDADGFRDAIGSDDNVLVWSGAVPPQRLPPPQINSAVLQEVANNVQAMKDVTGLHDASLGVRSNETSGKAIMARQREGDVATYVYHDNLQAAIKECGRVVNQLIPVVFDTARTIRIVGEDESTKVQKINDPMDPTSVDLNRGKYDIVIETGPSYSTKRVEAAESMIQFVQAVPAAGQVAGDLIAMAQDWPMAEEIGERLKRTLPPQITAKADEDMTPEEARAKQQAMQQAQQQAQEQQAMQQLAMRKAAAETKEAEAKANKANAEALQTILEVNQTPPMQIMAALFGPDAPDAYAQAMQGFMDAHAQAQAAQQQQAPQGPQQVPQAA